MSEKKEIQKFDPTKLMEGIKDRIKAEFASLIPDEQWNQMVKKEVDDFFNTTEQDRSYQSSIMNHKTRFDFLIKEMLSQYCTDKFKEYLNSEKFTVMFDSKGKSIMSAAITKIMVENSGDILMNFFGGMMDSAITDLKMKMQSGQFIY